MERKKDRERVILRQKVVGRGKYTKNEEMLENQ